EETPYVLEYNCRFGDPETQAVLPLIKSDLLPVFREIAEGRLQTNELETYNLCAFDVVLASGGYPSNYAKGYPIKGLDTLPEDVLCFHAGTRRDDGQWLTHGGRVLNIVATAPTFPEAARSVYTVVEKISFKDMYYRRDIGYKLPGITQ
ncbi:MAG: phosphoribosylamine--glycine ligase, partial [Calditrichaeota bacterium]